MSVSPDDPNLRLLFLKRHMAVTNKIHSTNNVDEIMVEVSADICTLFNADRLTIYSVHEDKQRIVAKIKTGLNSFKDVKLPIAEHSIAGYVALIKKMVNVKDVYDDGELKAINPHIRFLKIQDEKTGYRTKQMLVAPIVDAQNQELVGVIQLINNKAGLPFGAQTEEGVTELAQTLAIALRQRQKTQLVKTKYDFLIADAVLSPGEFELARRQAKKKMLDIEQVLIEEFQVRIPAIGQALAKFFGVPYEPFDRNRVKPTHLLNKLDRQYVEANLWLPIDDTKEGLTVLCLDPERIRTSGIASQAFPYSSILYKVTTLKEFSDTIYQLYGAEPLQDVGDGDPGDAGSVRWNYYVDDLSGLVVTAMVRAYRSDDRELLLHETADLWAHCLIMLGRQGLGLTDVLAELRRREGMFRTDEAPS